MSKLADGMQQKNISSNEKLRRSALAEYAIFKSGEDKDYDQLTFLAAQICEVPVAKISIIGKNNIWYKSVYGTQQAENQRENSFCERTIYADEEIFIINSNDHPEFFENAKPIYDRKFHFYAGVPLLNSNGHAIAVFCIFDTKIRKLDEDQKKALLALANQSLNLFESRKQKTKLQHVQRKLKQKYKDLEKFASLVSHDIKSPLANIISLTELLKDENKEKLDEQSRQYLDFLVESSYSLRNYVDGILSFYRSDHILEKDFEDVHLPTLLKKITDLYSLEENVEITYPDSGHLKNINKAALSQVFMNLISNALKYNNKEIRKVDITFKTTETYYCFAVSDNGNGINKNDIEKIFELFATLDAKDRHGNPGSGIGLATVKKHIDQMQGSIDVISEKNQGTTFKFKIKRP
ncbi:GAF domain-containing sensor histidine kinase [Salegentibacter sp. JZCK2]|uniref:sensor histidine kinase n=1 Tax=Salegentibacter tibetensis TaxID=2873600 RepID=UPI001CCC4A08|nr:GAF domain-containing sensor histidine kinase [Salegentibacter tibetensis]MBZ9728955.1 GAF domain-containing sensor histidine kinase [Salegentibacter tibetensis]